VLVVAPVKLPFSWPNRMDSTRFSGRAPQLTATNGLPARSEAPCTARAITSLPTPLSPRIRIGDLRLGRPLAQRLTWVMAGEAPIRSAKVRRPAAFFFSRSTSPFRSPICRALRIETMIRSGEAGLTKKSWAPACMALTTVSMPPVAVSTITGCMKPRARISFSVVQCPPRPGITRSSITASAGAPAISCVDRLLAALGLGHGEAFALQHRLDQAALGRIVIDDKDRLGHEEHTAIKGPRRYRHGLFWDGYAPGG
jgi:hypothetical protein